MLAYVRCALLEFLIFQRAFVDGCQPMYAVHYSSSLFVKGHSLTDVSLCTLCISGVPYLSKGIHWRMSAYVRCALLEFLIFQRAFIDGCQPMYAVHYWSSLSFKGHSLTDVSLCTLCITGVPYLSKGIHWRISAYVRCALREFLIFQRAFVDGC